MSAPASSASRVSHWPLRWAWVLCCATFPLVWVGGLITTTDAGMAVPDWPGTYGYNLFLYPWQTWMFGPWDLFIEHGHRLLASGVGLVTITYVVAVWRSPAHRTLRLFALAALGLVIGQGVLGGLRVVLNERTLAMAHGSTGPLFFAVTVALLIRTMAIKRQQDATLPSHRRVGWWWLLPALCYAQLVLGATIRHVPEDGRFQTFAHHVQAHLWGAGIVTLSVLVASLLTLGGRGVGRPKWLAIALAAVVVTQASLGGATWVAKYRLPGWAQAAIAEDGWVSDAWAGAFGPSTMAASTAGGWAETHVVSAHSAIGSLLLGLSVALAMTHRKLPTKPGQRSADESPTPRPIPA